MESIKYKLQSTLSAKRYDHCVAVADCAVMLAQRLDADQDKAYIAGLLHDCAKYLDDEEMLAAAELYGIVPDRYEKAVPHMLHAKMGEAIAKGVYGVDDTDILTAIRRHITGSIDMTPLDIALNLADYIEPGRDYPGVEVVRKLAERDILGALMEGLAHTMLYLLEGRAILHPDTLMTYNAIRLQMMNEREAFE